MTCLTISREQARYARERIAAAGLADKVEVREQDYRDATGTFDKVVSIEMFEAVGEKNWPVYFRAVHDRLAAGGRAVLQVITIANERFDTYPPLHRFHPALHFPAGIAAVRRPRSARR